VLEFQTYVPQATASEGLAQGPYMSAKVGFEPVTLTKGVKSSNEPPHPHVISLFLGRFAQ